LWSGKPCPHSGPTVETFPTSARSQPRPDLHEEEGMQLKSALFCLMLVGNLVVAGPALAQQQAALPPDIDPGEPVFAGDANPIPPEPAPFDPASSRLRAIYDADVAAGGTSYWFDRILARPFLNNNAGERTLLTRGRALYMYTHNPSVLGFAGQGTGANGGGGGAAYREAIQTGGTSCQAGPNATCNLYSVTVSGAALTEAPAERRQYPSYWSSVHTP